MAALDHVTLPIGNLAQAALVLEERLGFRLTITPQAPDNHGRIFLDRLASKATTGLRARAIFPWRRQGSV